MDKKAILIDKCEAMSLLTSKANGRWSLIKFIFQIPLILTSSVMCILNSFEIEGKSNMKIPNVVVNGVSVLLLSMQSTMRVAEKCELFKSLSNQFLVLAHQIENEEEELTNEKIKVYVDKYDSLMASCLFEDIPTSHKKEVMVLFDGRSLPLQLNGASGIYIKKKRISGNSIELSSQIV
jgi:hypothetical protein